MLILPIAMLPSYRLPSAAPASVPDPASALGVLKYDLAANQDDPELCFTLSESVARQPANALESFISVDPAVKLSATPRNDRLCLSGFAFGGSYTLSLKAGLPGIASQLAKDLQYRIDIPNRPPEYGFATPQGDVLLRLGNDGLPIRSVNMAKIDVRIFRIKDTNLLFDRARPALTSTAAADFAPAHGELTWQGTIEPAGDANHDALTMLPLDKTIGNLKPGLYVAVAGTPGIPADGRALPTQYFMVSDLGLTAYRSTGSLLVTARSLISAAAAPGIELALLADNNRELARVRTDGNGFARFDADMMRGNGGDRPVAIFAYGPAGEFATLNLDAVALGQAPGPVSATIRTDRTSYRPGETVNILALVRGDKGAPITKQTVTFSILRPNGTVFTTQTDTDRGGGAYNLSFAVPKAGSAGLWTVTASNDGGKTQIGSARVQVDGVRPARLSVTVGGDFAVIDPAQPANIAIQAQYPDGPAANLPGELSVTVSPAPVPFPAFPDFSFGLTDETPQPLALDPVRFSTDAAGKASLPVKIAPQAKVTKPLEAVVTAKLFDAGGQPIAHATTIPVATQGLLLGVKPSPASTFAAGQSAHFEIIAVSPDGARQEKAGAGWEILRQEPVPSWYWDGQRFAYRPGVKDTHIAGGTLDIPGNAAATLDSSLPAGRYRIEVFDPNGEAISSVHFTVGWAVATARDPGDSVAIKPAKPFYLPGDNVEFQVTPPYDADIVLTSADNLIRDMAVQHVTAAGATMRLAIPRDAGPDMQVIASAVAPPDPSAPALARRAIGLSGVATDPSVRKLDVKIEAPETMTPQQTISIPVAVSGAGEDIAFVQLSMIDQRPESDTAAADPASPQMLTATDNYGRVITQTGLSSGAIALPTASTEAHRSPVTVEAQAPLAVFSGIVALDKAGKGMIPITLPDFSGKATLKAISWAGAKSGQSDMAITIRQPLNVGLDLPAYLTPDDHADLSLSLDNADGPRGEYRVRVHAEGAIAIQDETEAVFNLAEHERRQEAVGVTARGPGDAAVIISVKGPNGMAFERRLELPVRSGAERIARHATVTLKAGGPLTVDPALTGGLRPETLAFSLVAGDGFDLNGIVAELKATRPESAEDIVDAASASAMPAAGTGAESKPVTATLERAALAVAGYQNGDGGFSLFPAEESDPWLTAYIVDFLTRARKAGAAIPDTLLGPALDYLALHAEPVLGQQEAYTQETLTTAAYAQWMLAANGRLNLFQLRYFNDRFQTQFRSPVAIALIASAFTSQGDKASAAATFARATSMPIDPALTDIFGSDLRDQAMLTALLAESGLTAQPAITGALAKTAAIAAAHRQFNTQEAAWIVRAAAGQMPAGGQIKLKIGDKTIEQTKPFATSIAGAALPAIKNNGETPLRIALTVTGSPAQGEPKDQAGYEIQRWFYDIGGKPIDPTTMRQGDLAVVVITGRFTGQGDANPLVTDALPAGWAMEAAEIADPLTRYPWLKDLTGSSFTAAADGRYLAVPRLAGDRHEFKLAYVVRAATRGQFGLPGPVVEDMGQAGLSARAAGSRTKIDPAS